jgi:adenine-specific DNA-methyltransferase
MKAAPKSKTARVAVARETTSILQEQVESLRVSIPEVFSEGKIDFEKLRTIFGEIIDTRPEKFTFAWSGKRNAIQILQMPTRATLVPAKNESVNFDNTKNFFIEADNLEALKLLYKSYFGKVKMIYIDPPYNTGNDFVYPDDYADPLDTYLKITGQKDSKGNVLTTNPETSGRYHSDWLSMMYPRLFVARQLLRDDGVIFVTIDDKEVHNLRLLMNEIFGEENFIACIIWQHSIQPKGYIEKFSVHHNYVLCYQASPKFSLEVLERKEEHNKNYANPDNDPNGPWRSGDVRNALYRPNLIFDITTPSGKIIKPPKNGWRWSKQTIQKKIATGEIVFNDDETKIIRKIYLKNVKGRAPETIWFGKEVGTTRDAVQELKDLFEGETPFDTPKPTGLVLKMLEIATEANSGDIVMDFFAGSATTADAVLQMNRKDRGNRSFIMVQLQESTPEDSLARKSGFKTVAEIGKERIRRAISRLKKEQQSQLKGAEQTEDLGFRVYKLAVSNFKPWKGVQDKTAETYASEMESHIDPLVDGWTKENVVYEVAIKEGFGLASTIEQEKFKDNEVWRVTDPEKEQTFLVCLDDKIKTSMIRSLKLTKEELFVCRDIALDDTGAANLALQCNLKTI